MYIRNKYTPGTSSKPLNNVACTMNPVSLTEPDDSLTVKELFARYMDGSLERSKRALERKQEYDGYNPDIDMDFGGEDLVDEYENRWTPEVAGEKLEMPGNREDQASITDSAAQNPGDSSLKPPMAVGPTETTTSGTRGGSEVENNITQ